jgi:hypothetical protein
MNDDDDELEPPLRALLDSASAAPTDFPEDRRAAMRASLEARIAPGAPASRAPPHSLGRALRAGGLLALGAVMGAAAMRALAPSPAPTAVVLSVSAPLPSVAIAPTVAPSVAPPAPPPVAAPPRVVRTSATSTAASAAPSIEIDDGPTAPSRPSTLKEERPLLEQARAAIARGDGVAALDALDEHSRKFPDSKLAEERDALVVEALVARGRLDDAARKARAFEVRYPRSVFLERIEQVHSDPPSAAP